MSRLSLTLLNVAEDCRKLGDLVSAREYLGQAQGSVDVLPVPECSGMIRSGIARLAERLAPAADIRRPAGDAVRSRWLLMARSAAFASYVKPGALPPSIRRKHAEPMT